MIGTLKEIADTGKVAHVGLSNADPDQIRAAHAVLGDALVSVQNQFSPKFRSSRPEIDVCEELGLAFLPWSPLGGLSDAKELADKHPRLRRDRRRPRGQRPAGRPGVGARAVTGRHPDPRRQATLVDHRLRGVGRDRADRRRARPARRELIVVTRPLLTRALDTAMDRSFVLGYTTIGLGVRRALPGWPADPPPGSLDGRHVLVTGASSGLGVATVEGVADLGAIVHLLVRDEAKGARVADEIREARPGAELRLWRCDVADLDDVRRFATDFAAEVEALHAVVHNAGVMPPTRTESPQGFELSMAVHLLGPVAMTEALRAALAGGRVVFVSSGGMYGQPLRADDPGYTTGDYAPATSYARSKRWQVEMAPLLAERWATDEITVATMHPGWADTPGVQESLPRFRRITRPVLRDDAQGADTSVWLAAVDPAPPTGLFWHDRVERPTSLLPATRPSADARARAWAWLNEAAGLP